MILAVEIQNYAVRSLLSDPEQPSILAQFIHYDRESVLFRPASVYGTSVAKGPLQLLYA
jgi:hypothetical protein